MSRRTPRSRSSGPSDVFLNIPYDRRFGRLYIAFIAGLASFGLKPRATLEIPGGERRLDRIVDLIRACSYSLHDLSRVQLDRRPPSTPRFNMPFELGLAVAWAKVGKRSATWFVFESMSRRLQKSLSDLDGTDVYVHDGSVDGVFRELSNAFVRSDRQPTIQEMRAVYADLKRASRRIRRQAGAKTIFEARVFKNLVYLAGKLADAAQAYREPARARL